MNEGTLSFFIFLSLVGAYLGLVVAFMAVQHQRSHCDDCSGYVDEFEENVPGFVRCVCDIHGMFICPVHDPDRFAAETR